MDEHTRTVKVRVQVSNEHGKLKPGMFAKVKAVITSKRKSAMVPRESVLSDEGRSFVFLHHKDDLWARRGVEVGLAQGPLMEIVSGLDGNETVVTSGAFMLKSDVLRGKMGAG